jgi:CDP-glycerol glycerophosphotransferase
MVFMSFQGRRFDDTPKAIYEYMKSRKKYDDFRFVWAFRNPEDHKVPDHDGRTTIVKWPSVAFLQALSEAGYWISNNRVLPYVYPRDDQVYVQCWHGTPLKRLGHDLKETTNAIYSLKDLLHKYDMDAMKMKFFVSPSAYATEKFISAFDLTGKGKEGAILEVGYPRNDRIVTATREDRAAAFKNLGILEDSGKKVILYAPTWREDQYGSTGYTYRLGLDFSKLLNALGDDYIFIFRVHYFISNSFDFSSFGSRIINMSEHDDINDLYIASDMLITDYSSVFFDYANTDKPIIFYMYDLDEYQDKARGFYINLDELPGDIVMEERYLSEAIKRASNPDAYAAAYDEKYRAFKAKYTYLDDGRATERLVDRIFADDLPIVSATPYPVHKP